MRILLLLLTASLASAAGPALRGIDGELLHPFEPDAAAMAVFFVCTDCPVSNFYAPVIQDLCHHYRSRGVACALLYEDLQVDASAVRRHMHDYGYGGIPAAIDAQRLIATRAGATVTPQAVLIDPHGRIRYRGRIDNLYAALGRPRRQATQHDVRDAIDAVLAGRPVLNAETKSFGCYIVSPEILEQP